MAEKKPEGKPRTPRAKKPALTLDQLRREIAERAHEIFQERISGRRRGGDELSDWLSAEAEVKKRHGVT